MILQVLYFFKFIIYFTIIFFYLPLYIYLYHLYKTKELMNT